RHRAGDRVRDRPAGQRKHQRGARAPEPPGVLARARAPLAAVHDARRRVVFGRAGKVSRAPTSGNPMDRLACQLPVGGTMRNTLALGAIATAALAIAGCGGGGKKTASTAASTTASAPAQSTTASSSSAATGAPETISTKPSKL